MPMNQQRALIVLVLVAIGFLLLAFFYTRDAKREGNLPASPDAEAPVSQEGLVTITKRTYQDGVHIWEGSVSLPTPCHRLESPSVTVAESYPEQVRITLVSRPPAGPCAQVITEKTFTANFKASQNASVSVTLDGKPASLVFDEGDAGRKLLPEGEKPALVQ